MTSTHPQILRCQDIAIRGAWHHPFFLIPLGHCEWHEGKAPQIETMAVSTVVREGKPEIHLFVNPDWVAGVPDDEVFGCLCHEMMHPMLHHMARLGGRKLDVWNQATDMAINQSLVSSGIKLPSYVLFPPKEHSELAAEELYELLENDEIPKQPKYSPGKVGAGCAQTSGNPMADPDAEPGEGESNSSGGDQPGDGGGDQIGAGGGEGQSDDRAWGEMVAQAQAQGRGTGTAKAMAKLFKPAPTKTKWDRLLRREATRAATKRGADCQTWSRINRRSEEIIFPGLIAKRPSIAVLIDSSGSVSEEMLRAAISNTIAAAKVSGVNFFLALHDGICYFPPADDKKAGWMTQRVTVEQISSYCTHRGGTDARGGFEMIGKAGKLFDCMIYLTDGEVGIYPEKPSNVRRMIVGILGNRPSTWRAEVPDRWTEIAVEVEIGG